MVVLSLASSSTDTCSSGGGIHGRTGVSPVTNLTLQRHGPDLCSRLGTPTIPAMFAHTVGGGALPAPPWLLSYIGVALMLGTAAALRATWPSTRGLVDLDPRHRSTAPTVGVGERRRASSSWSPSSAPPSSGPDSARRQHRAGGGARDLVGRAADPLPAARRRHALAQPLPRPGAGRPRARTAAPTDGSAPAWTAAALLAAVQLVLPRLPPARARRGRWPCSSSSTSWSSRPARCRWGRAWVARPARASAGSRRRGRAASGCAARAGPRRPARRP